MRSSWIAALVVGFAFGFAAGHATAANPPARVVWHWNTECPSYPSGAVLGCTNWPAADGTIQVYISPGLGGRLDDVAWHEAGHVVDFTVLTDRDRARWARINGRAGEAWWDRSTPDPPGEWFAESYRQCALHDGPMTYDYYPTRRQLRRTCNLIGALLE